MIITSLLDTDLYKFTMMQVVLHQFPGAQVEYKFKCRNPGVQLAPFVAEIRAEIRSLCSLQFQDDELAYLRSLRFIKSDFVDFLGLFRLNEKYITVTPQPSGEIDITIRGPWLHTILFEIPVLAIVNEVYFRNTQKVPDFPEGRRRLDTKIAQLQAEGLADLKIADYGTRRRFSRAWHEELLRVLVARLGTGDRRPGAPPGPGQFAGTSNVLYAMKLGVTPLGTMAHEYLQACQALGPRLRDSQVFGFEMWSKEYRGDLGIALSDVYGMSAFRPLPQEPRGPVDQNTDLQRRPHGAAHHPAVPAVPGALPAGVWHWHQPHQRPRLRAAAGGHQDDAMQRPAGGQGV